MREIGFGFVELQEVGADFTLLIYFGTDETVLRMNGQITKLIKILVLVFGLFYADPVLTLFLSYLTFLLHLWTHSDL